MPLFNQACGGVVLLDALLTAKAGAPAHWIDRVDWAMAMAVAGLLLSIFNFVRQYSYFRGTVISVLNTDQVHRIVPLEFRQLPRSARDLFTNYPEARPGFALVSIPWCNSGDRGGFVRVVSVEASGSDIDGLKCAYYAYHDLKPEHVYAQPVLVRNLPLDCASEVTLKLRYQWVSARWLRPGQRSYVADVTIRARLEPVLTWR